MSEPSVLLVELDRQRRRSLALGLAAEGYEVVPAIDREEAVRFADGLGPAVIVAPLALALDPAREIAESFQIHGGERTLLLVGTSRDEEHLVGDDALFVAAGGKNDAELLRQIRLALVGRRIGVEPDLDLEALVGDLTQRSLLDLARRLHGVRASATVRLDGGTVWMRGGELVAAEAGAVRGVKAFCRLARRSDGPFRVILGDGGMPERELREDLDSVIHVAVQDALEEIPNPRTRFEVRVGPGFFERPFNPVQKEILALVDRGGTLGPLLDQIALPDGEVLREILDLERRGALAREEPQPAVTVVTDSTADLPADLLDRHRIGVVPLTIHFGDEAYVDGEELAPGEFYRLLESHPEHPHTNPPPPARFALEFERRLERQDVVALHLSESMSQTVVHSRSAAAKQSLERYAREGGAAARLEVLDTGQVSLPLGLLALFAARMALRGLAAQEIVDRLSRMSARIETMFVVNTLEYLARGGRIGKARAWIGRLMGIKPILGVEEGEVVPVDRVRGGRAAQPRLIELAAARLEPDLPVVAGIAHARAPAWADRLRALIEERFEITELYVAEMGPVVGTHVGPGCVGATFFQPQGDEGELVAPLGADFEG